MITEHRPMCLPNDGTRHLTDVRAHFRALLIDLTGQHVHFVCQSCAEDLALWIVPRVLEFGRPVSLTITPL